MNCIFVGQPGRCGFECASADYGLLAYSVHHHSVCGATSGTEGFRGVQEVLLGSAQWKTAHLADTYGKSVLFDPLRINGCT